MLKDKNRNNEALVESLKSNPAWEEWPGPDANPDGQPSEEKLKARARGGEKAPATESPAPAGHENRTVKPEAESGAPRASFPRRKPFTSGMLAILLALVLGAGYLYWDYARHFETTDDAFIAARQIAIAPKVPGYVTEVPVTDNEHVAKGGVIARIDDRDYRIAVEQANAQVQAAQASLENIAAQIAVQQAQIVAGEAQVEQAKAALSFAQQQAVRYETLAKTGSGSVQNAQQYSSQLLQQEAALKNAEATLKVAQRAMGSLQAQRKSAEAALLQAMAQREQALLNLSYTTVVTAEAGRVVNLTAAPGEYAQPGTNLTMFVPDEIWVTANFKETQLDRMRPGQAVEIGIDAYPERDIEGHVASVQPGSGTAFSLLPAQNATGNYVKIVQRVPVKILVDNWPSDVALGPGMSVVPNVRVDPKPSLYEKLASFFDRL